MEGITALADALCVTASVTRLLLKDNNWGAQGAQHLSEALKVNKSVTELDISNSEQRSSGDIRAEGAKYIAEMLSVNASVTKLSLANNDLKEEGTKAVCEALHGNKTLKELDLRGGAPEYNNIGEAAGAKHVAHMLGVNASITTVCQIRQVIKCLS